MIRDEEVMSNNYETVFRKRSTTAESSCPSGSLSLNFYGSYSISRQLSIRRDTPSCIDGVSSSDDPSDFSCTGLVCMRITPRGGSCQLLLRGHSAFHDGTARTQVIRISSYILHLLSRAHPLVATHGVLSTQNPPNAQEQQFLMT